jgi:hypothetical protein
MALAREGGTSGVSGKARQEGDDMNWRDPPHPWEKSQEKGRFYNQEGKRADGERMADGFIC